MGQVQTSPLEIIDCWGNITVSLSPINYLWNCRWLTLLLQDNTLHLEEFAQTKSEIHYFYDPLRLIKAYFLFLKNYTLEYFVFSMSLHLTRQITNIFADLSYLLLEPRSPDCGPYWESPPLTEKPSNRHSKYVCEYFIFCVISFYVVMFCFVILCKIVENS